MNQTTILFHDASFSYQSSMKNSHNKDSSLINSNKQPHPTQNNSNYYKDNSHIYNPGNYQCKQSKSIQTDETSQNNDFLNQSESLKQMSIQQYECYFRKIQKILNLKNETLQKQNDYLKHQIRKLYAKQTQSKQKLKKMKDQIKVLKYQNQIYQDRYYYLKQYIIDISANIQSHQQQKQLQINSPLFISETSKNLIIKLKQNLYGVQNISHLNDKKIFSLQSDLQTQISQIQPKVNRNIFTHPSHYFNQQQIKIQKDFPQNIFENQMQSKFLPTSSTLNENPNSIKFISTPLILESPTQISQLLQKSQKKNLNQNLQNVQQQVYNLKNDKVQQQINSLMDQCQALIYEYRKTENKDKEIKKKIIKVSQQIRQLKMKR